MRTENDAIHCNRITYDIVVVVVGLVAVYAPWCQVFGCGFCLLFAREKGIDYQHTYYHYFHYTDIQMYGGMIYIQEIEKKMFALGRIHYIFRR